ncbi:MAG: molybdopterin-binding/glycosyltransferase family 2 protein [Pseudomonadota bacterium]|nr:molybdopterin-binding/glycosyltransferase family 2 protein [Pseudomonadota bacterium]
MKFGSVPVSQASGAILAHALRLPDGRRLKKGTVLGAGEIAALTGAAIEHVIAARLESGDIGENDAARRIADALVSPHIRVESPATGRVNLYATHGGIFRAERNLVDTINAIDPGITFATLDHLAAVEGGRMVATVKIIPYALAESSVEKAEAAAKAGEVIGLDPYRAKRIGVVATQLPSLKPSVMDKTIRVLEDRLAASGSRVVREIRTGHAETEIAAAIGELLPDCDMVLIFGASAICDIEDVIPAAIRARGGRIVHFGMPVDPGNLMLLAEIGDKPVIGAPGCARSPAENGFDWILQRLLAGREVTADEIAGMGVGGLLMEIGARPQPREARKNRARRIAAVVLAAGRSTRMGETNKLLVPLGGKPMVRWAVEAARASAASETVVVTGHEAEKVGAAVAGSGARIVHNTGFARGLSTSLAAGISALPDSCDGAIILLGDMPHITTAMVDRMIDAAQGATADAIIMAAHGGARGNPVLWPRGDFEALRAIEGDTGARALIAENGARVVAIELGEAAGFDIDTPQELERAGEKPAP